MNNEEKGIAVCSYFGILVLVPLLAGKTSFSKFHANQGLILMIIEMVVGAVCGVIGGVLGGIPGIRVLASILTGIIGGVVGLVVLILAIMGIISAVNGEEKPLPGIGGIKLIK